MYTSKSMINCLWREVMKTALLSHGGMLLVLIAAMACAPQIGTSPPLTASDLQSTVSEEQPIPLCEIGEEQVGSQVSTSGTIILIEEGNPEGKFAMLEDGGCRVGIFAPFPMWEQWKAADQEAFQTGTTLNVRGKLNSFEGQLVILLEDIQPAGSPTKDAESKEYANLDLPPALDEMMLDVPLLYSGSNDLPGLCYLGAAGMLVKYEHPKLDFADVVAFSGMGSSALHLNFPEVPSMLISPYMMQSIVFMLNNMRADYALGFQEGGSASDPFQPAALPFESNATYLFSFMNSDEALDTLKRAVSDGHPVMVHLNFYAVYDDFAAISEYWRDVIGKDPASHFMVVKGYDAQYIYVNDPTDPTAAAGQLKTSVENFMQAWEETDAIPGAPPMGPFWMLFLIEPGSPPAADAVIEANLLRADEAPAQIRSFAEQPDDSESTLALLLELGNARLQFGAYLARNGFDEASEMYIKSGTILTDLALNQSMDAEMLLEAADLEERAIPLLQSQQ